MSEDAEAKSFWDDFFHVFGISRCRVATFEQQIIQMVREDTNTVRKKFRYAFLPQRGNLFVEKCIPPRFYIAPAGLPNEKVAPLGQNGC